ALPSRDALLVIVDRLRRRKVAVIGDLVLDEYWVGRSSRISREAPVLILEHEEERRVPGGPANAAMNVRALGGAPVAVGGPGGDRRGEAGEDSRRRRFPLRSPFLPGGHVAHSQRARGPGSDAPAVPPCSGLEASR